MRQNVNGRAMQQEAFFASLSLRTHLARGRDANPGCAGLTLGNDLANASARAVCVYCASSRVSHADYRLAARRLGAVLAGERIRIVYGGGAAGSMGALADGALAAGGEVIGILPRFMADLEWGHPGLTQLQLVEDLRVRKHQMLAMSQAAIALPGGSGTLEELLEAITLKRLGLYLNPIVLVNTRDFFAPLLTLLAHTVEERFMDVRHLSMWQVVATPEEVPAALARAPAWSAAARSFAAL
jgi:uncharacterized protein (TIGR00730 family)